MQLNPSFLTPGALDGAVRKFETAAEQKLAHLRKRVDALEAVINASGKKPTELPPLAKRVRVRPFVSNHLQDWRLSKPDELRRVITNHNQVLGIQGVPGAFLTAETQLGVCGQEFVEIPASLLSSIINDPTPIQVPAKMRVYRQCDDYTHTLYHVLDPIMTFCVAVELGVLPYSKEELETLKMVIFDSIQHLNPFTISFEWDNQTCEFRNLNYYLLQMLAAAWRNIPTKVLQTTPCHHYYALLNTVTCVHHDRSMSFLPLDWCILQCLHPDNFKDDFLIHSNLAHIIIPSFAAQSLKAHRHNRDVTSFFRVLAHLHHQKYPLNYKVLHDALIELLPTYLETYKKFPPITLQHLKTNYVLNDLAYQLIISRQVVISHPQITQFRYSSAMPVVDDDLLLKGTADEFQKETVEIEKKLADMETLLIQLEQRHPRPANVSTETHNSPSEEI